MIKTRFSFGLTFGTVLTLALFFALRAFGVTSNAGDPSFVLASIGSEKLTRQEAKPLIGAAMTAVENDEYIVLKRAAKEWMETTVLEKEAGSQGISVNTLLAKNVWSKVKVSKKLGTREAKKKRQKLFMKEKQKYIKDLYKRYKGKLHLKKPETYVPNLAIVEDALKAKKKKRKNTLEKASPAGKSPTMGPEDAPITIVEYADFYCSYCKKVAPTMKKLLENFSGDIHYTLKHYPLGKTPGKGSYLAHEASACAQEQGKFWEYHDKIIESSSGLTREDFVRFAKEFKLNKGQFEKCFDSGKYRDMIAKDRDDGDFVGVTGTPAIFINGEKAGGAKPYHAFKELIEGILDPSKAKKKAAPTPVSEKVEFNDLEGRPMKGPANAPVTLVEFSDFHCPFCKRVLPSVDKAMEQFKGKVKLVWRHYPLPFHAGAERTHEATECADDQGKFWEFHDKLFEKPGAHKGDEALLKVAGEVGLNEQTLKECLESGKYKKVVQDDIKKGNEVGVKGTPTFFINGEKLVGAQPFEQFENAIQRALDPSVKRLVKPAQKPSKPPAPKGPVTITDNDGKPSKGPQDAPITLTEFSDFHCPFCNRASPTVNSLIENNPGKIRRVWRHYPLPFHKGAERTHMASQCADDQGKFWEFKEKAFEKMGTLKSDDDLLSIGNEINLDEKKFKDCLESNKYAQLITDEIKSGSKYGVRGTPAFFINGRLISGAQPLASFQKAVDEELK